MVHKGHHSVRGHWRRVKSGGRQEGRHVQGHGTLAGVEHEEFAPDEPEQRHLVRHLQVREERDVARPFHGAEQQPGRQFADVVDAHDVVGLHALRVSRRRVRFRPQQQRDEARQVRVSVQRLAIRQGHLSGQRVLAGRNSSSLDRCEATEGRRQRGRETKFISRAHQFHADAT